MHEPDEWDQCFLGVYGRSDDAAPDHAGTFDGRVRISDADYERYRDAATRLHGLNGSLTLRMVARNHLELQGLLDFYRMLLGVGRKDRIGQIETRDAAFNLMASVVNWLSSFRLFLDHQETLYKRRHGKSSTQVQRFNAVCARQYDGSAAYRIVYRFRNYVQHCGLPLSNISTGPATDSELNGSVAFTIERDRLLQEFDWGRARADIEAEPGQVDVMELINTTMESVDEIAREVQRIDLEYALEGVDNLREALDRLPRSDGEVPILVRMRGSGTTVHSITPMPLFAMADLERLDHAAQCDDPAAYLTEMHEPIDPPEPFAAETQRRIDIGIDLLSVWLADGGSSARYHERAHALVAEHGVEPVLTGAATICGYTLSLAAGALGASREGILGALGTASDRDWPAIGSEALRRGVQRARERTVGGRRN